MHLLSPALALVACIAALCCSAHTIVHANGRLPGATGLAINPADEQQLLIGLSFGLALTRDGGASWTWMCEEQIEGNGSDVDPSIVVTRDGTLIVLSLTNGGVLVSRNDGCSFERALGPLKSQRGVDLTLDPNQPGHVFLLLSTILDVTAAGYPRFHTFVAHSVDNGRSWEPLAELPDDIAGETIEVAPSDSRRIYVSGTASSDPLQGIVERSDDAGLTWTRTTTPLPRGSGSLFLSGIHPRDPDRLWFRVPGRGDIYGVLPARLWLSTDAAVTFNQVAETKAGMLGFALSPDGDQVAFGGPIDGLLVAPADSSAAPAKVSDMRVNCLRWASSGLYACASEPTDPYSLGYAAEPTQGFSPLWRRANTCRAACAPPSPLEMKCRQPWETIAPLLNAENAVCGAAATTPALSVDAGAPTSNDGRLASAIEPQPTAAGPSAPANGCSAVLPLRAQPTWCLPSLLLLAGWMRGLRRRDATRSRETERMPAQTSSSALRSISM